MSEPKNLEQKFNVVYLVLSIIVLAGIIASAYFLTPIINANTWKNNIENKVALHDQEILKNMKDIEQLKMSDQSAEKILVEMQFNLKNYLRSKGFPYTEYPKIDKVEE